MSRKQFIESQGATCDNWTWSWSFINVDAKIIIFGAWDKYTEGNTSLIFSEEWEFRDDGRKKAGYRQSRDHIRLIEEEGYQLQTFPMVYSDANESTDGRGSAKIGGFEPVLKTKTLKRVAGNWYASDDLINTSIPEEVHAPQKYIEGTSKKISVNSYERSAKARKKCIEFHGYLCVVCSFDFEKYYGSIGKYYIHVHHIIPLSEIGEDYLIDPVADLIPVCANCHAMIHRTEPPLTVEQLREHLSGHHINT